MLATFATSTGARRLGVAILVADDPTGPYKPWSDGPGSKGHDHLVFRWPNNTPDERVKLTEVEIKGARVRILG